MDNQDNPMQPQIPQPAALCPQCGSGNITFKVFQEKAGTTTVSRTKSKYKEQKHGCLWWLCIGWWWWIIDLFLWIFAFPFRAIIALTRKKRYKGASTTVEQKINQVSYKTLCLCGNCGNTWVKSDISSNTMQDAVKKNVKKLKRNVRL